MLTGDNGIKNNGINLIINYLKEHEDDFLPQERNRIAGVLWRYEYMGFNLHDSLFLEICDELGILPDEFNPYKAFCSLIDEQFKIKSKNVIEIGGGKIPRLGKRIAAMQDIGSITVYDPDILINDTDYSNLKLVKRYFYSNINVKDANVLVGLLPCGCGSLIVNSAMHFNKDFMIALCDEHNNNLFGDSLDSINWPDDFIKKTEHIVEENGMGKLKVKTLKEIGDNYPIIYNER